MRRLIFLFVLSFSLASGEDIYVAQTTLGAGTGADAANTRSVIWFNTSANWGGGVGEIDPGDTVHLVGTISSQLVPQLSGSLGNPVTVVFENSAKLSKAQWGSDSSGAVYLSGKSHIVIDGGVNGVIENTDNGDALGVKLSSTGIFLSACSDVEIKNLTIQDMFVHTPGVDNPPTASAYSSQAVKSSNGSRVSVHDCVMNDMYMAVYFYTETAVTVTGNRAYRNTIRNCSTALIAACGAAGSQINDTYFYDNDIMLGVNWFDTPNANHIDGIHTWTGSTASMSGMYIYGNYIHGDSSAHCTGYIFVTDNVPSAYIFNNLCDGNIAGTNHASEGWINFNLLAGSHVYVLFNTINGNGTGSEGGNGISHDPGATGSTITAAGNIITNTNIGFYEGASWTTYDFYKNCYYANGSAGRRGATYYTTLGSWQAVSGDAGSISSSPGFDSIFRYTSASPCYLAGGDLRTLVPSGLLGYYRDGSPRPAGAMSLGSEPLQVGGDVTAPTPNPATIIGTPTKSSTTISVTASAATDETALGSNPYEFSSDNGTTSSSGQFSASYTFTGLTPSTAYQIRVRYRDAAGNATAWSTAQVSTTNAGGTDAPVNRKKQHILLSQ